MRARSTAKSLAAGEVEISVTIFRISYVPEKYQSLFKIYFESENDAFRREAMLRKPKRIEIRFG